MRHYAISLFLFGALTTPVLAQTDDLFVSFYNTDTVGLYDGVTGALLNSSFASVQDPIGLALGPGNNLYVGSDNLSGIDGAGIAVFAINGTTSTPQGNFVTHANDDALNNPQGLAFSGGNLYAADITAGQIFVYNNTGTHIQTISSINLGAPVGISFAASGTLYIADENNGNVLSYSGGNLAQVNSQTSQFNGARDVVAGNNGSVYLLDTSSSPTGGIWSINLSDGSAQKIVDYSTSSFQASNLALGPDGDLYVSGQDLDSSENEILKYGLDGSGGGVFVDLGTENEPSFLTFVTPEPSFWSLAGLAVVICGICLPRFRRFKSQN